MAERRTIQNVRKEAKRGVGCVHLKPRTRGVAEKMGNEKITFARWHVGVLAYVLVQVLGSKRALELALIWSTEHTELQRFIFTPESTDKGGRFQEGSRPCEPRPYAPRPAGTRALPGEIPNPITGFSDRRSRRKQRAAEARLSEDASPYPVDGDRWTVEAVALKTLGPQRKSCNALGTTRSTLFAEMFLGEKFVCIIG